MSSEARPFFFGWKTIAAISSQQHRIKKADIGIAALRSKKGCEVGVKKHVFRYIKYHQKISNTDLWKLEVVLSKRSAAENHGGPFQPARTALVIGINIWVAS